MSGGQKIVSLVPSFTEILYFLGLVPGKQGLSRFLFYHMPARSQVDWRDGKTAPPAISCPGRAGIILQAAKNDLKG
jgi:hypothetical protein